MGRITLISSQPICWEARLKPDLDPLAVHAFSEQSVWPIAAPDTGDWLDQDWWNGAAVLKVYEPKFLSADGGAALARGLRLVRQ